MIAIPISVVQRQLDSCPKLLSGRRFIDQIIEDRVVPDGCYPVISGGAVRDGVLFETEPHDIDIFFAIGYVRGDLFNGQWSIQNETTRAANMSLLLEDIKGWLEDKEIPYISLMSNNTPIEGYQNSGFIFNEILEFVFEETTIQLMFTELRTLSNISDNFPAVARIFMARDHVFFTHTGYAAMNFSGDRIPVCNEREARYVLKKWPEANVVRFINGSDMYNTFVRENSNLVVERIGDLFDSNGSLIRVGSSQNGLKALMISILCEKFNCSTQEMEQWWVGDNLRADWSEGLSEIQSQNRGLFVNSNADLWGQLRNHVNNNITRNEVRPASSQHLRSTMENLRRTFGSVSGPSVSDLEGRVVSGTIARDINRREAQFDAELGLAPTPPGGWDIPTSR